MFELMFGCLAVMVIFVVRVMVSAPLPAGQPPLAALELAALMAFARLQDELTVMLAAYTAGTGATRKIADIRIVNVMNEKTGLVRDIEALHELQQLNKVCVRDRHDLLYLVSLIRILLVCKSRRRALGLAVKPDIIRAPALLWLSRIALGTGHIHFNHVTPVARSSAIVASAYPHLEAGALVRTADGV